MSDYYTASSDPTDNSDATPDVLRAEHAAIAAGFAKIAPYTGNGSKIVRINAGATAQEAVDVTALGVQPLDADLTAIAALVSAADKLPYATGAQTWALTDLSAFGRTLIDDANAPAALATLGAATSGANTDITSVGAVTGVTAAGGDSSTKLATTAFVVGSASGCGQCQLQYVSTISIKLMPWNGNLLKVNGSICTVPDAGVSLANTGLTQATLYYIYATASAGAINALEASTTVPVVDTTAGNKGVKIKTGDSARTLVGMVYMNTGAPGLFGSSSVFQGVRSWFNDCGMAGNSGLTADKTTASPTYVKLDSATDITFIVWAGEIVTPWFAGMANIPGSGSNTGVAVSYDGTTPEDSVAQISTTVAVPIAGGGIGRALTEGAHVASLIAAQTGSSTLTVFGAAAPSSSTHTRRTSFGVKSSGVNP